MKLPSLFHGNRGKDRRKAGMPIRGGASPLDSGSWAEARGGDVVLEDLLNTYAAEALSPDAATLARGREAMLAAMAAKAERAESPGPALVAGSGAVSKVDRQPTVAPAGSFGPSVGGRSHGGRSTGSMRPKLFAAMAAVAILLVGAVGVAAESGPGQPFYRLRLNVEAVDLPPAGSTARAQADLTRAQARLDEIVGKESGGDWNAAADAASAYDQVVASMATPAAGTAGLADRQKLEDQLASLLALRDHWHGEELQALDKAIARLQALLGQAPAASPSPSATSCAAPGSAGDGHDGTGNGNGNGRGDGSGHPGDCQGSSSSSPAAGNPGGGSNHSGETAEPGPSGQSKGGPGDGSASTPSPSAGHGKGGGKPEGTAAPSDGGHHGQSSPEPSRSPGD